MKKSKPLSHIITKKSSNGNNLYYWECPLRNYVAGFPIRYERLSDNPKEQKERAKQLNTMLNDFKANLEIRNLIPKNMQKTLEAKMSMEELFSWYKQSVYFTDNISSSTRNAYRYYIKSLSNFNILWNGKYIKLKHIKINDINTRNAWNIVNSFKNKTCSTNGGAAHTNRTFMMVKRIFNLAVKYDLIANNPFRNIEKFSEQRSTKDLCFSRNEVRELICTADKLNLRGLGTAIMLAYYLCQRQGDVISSLTRDCIDKDFTRICFYQHKTMRHKSSFPIIIPLYDNNGDEVFPGLVPRIKKDLSNHSLNTIVAYEHKECKFMSYNSDLLRKHFNQVRKLTSISIEKKFMHLRHSGLTELGNSGATEQEIISLSGHHSSQMVARYVRKTAQQALNGSIKRFL